MSKEENTTILRDIALEIFHIRKIRFLMSAPNKDVKETKQQNLFNKVEVNLKDLWINRSVEEQEICYDYFIQCSRAWEGFCLKNDKISRFECRDKNYVMSQIRYLIKNWFYSLEFQWELIILEEDHKIQQARQNMIINREIISNLVQQKIDKNQIESFIREAQFVKFRNEGILIGIWGFTSLTSNKIYLNDNHGYQYLQNYYLEALLVDGFCYWLIKDKNPLIIVSEYYQSKIKNGYISEFVDVYLWIAYGKHIYFQSPFRMCQYQKPFK